MEPHVLRIDELHAHPANSNVMPPEALGKLTEHLRRSGRYPPVIVRRSPHAAAGGYQILDGHHRVEALRRIGVTEVRCVVWDVDDQEALVLLATLNRLQGQDDPRKRAALVHELSRRIDVSELAARLPEELEQVEKLLKLHSPPPPRPPQDVSKMPVAVHFFLLPEQRRELEAELGRRGGSREEALMQLVTGSAR